VCESIKVLKGILPATFGFQDGDGLSMVQIGLLVAVEETCISVKNSMYVRGKRSSTLFPCEN
jgi:hypothetical protein